MDEKEAERLQKLIDEVLSEDNEHCDYDDDDESEEDAVVVEVHNENSDTEQDVSDDDRGDSFIQGPVYISKDKITTWNRHAPIKNIRIRAENNNVVCICFV